MKYIIFILFLLTACSESDPQKKSNAVSWTFSVASTGSSPSISGEFQTENNKVLAGGNFSIGTTKYLVIETEYAPEVNDVTLISLQTKFVDGSNPEAYLQFNADISDSQIKASGVIYWLYSDRKSHDLPNFVINKK